MTRFKNLRTFLPEIILICVVLFYWLWSTPLNPVAAGLLALLIVQLKFRKTKLGLFIGGLFLFLSFWMLMAFVSDLVKPPHNPENIINFIISGTALCVVLFSSSVFMLKKYISKNETD